MKKIISAAIMTAIIFFCFVNAFADDGQGNLFSFGSYPRSQVTDSELAEKLNMQITAKDIKFDYFKTYSGDGINRDSAAETKAMKYADVSFEGEKYRCVVIEKYRPFETFQSPLEENSSQDDSGFSKNTKYWFKYEPVKWQVLDEKSGLSVCLVTLDGESYRNTLTAIDKDRDGLIANDLTNNNEYFADANETNPNDWLTSSVRGFLNKDFLNTAFSSSEKEELSADANGDRVFYLSKEDFENTAYFPTESDRVICTVCTPYSLCRGVDSEIYAVNTRSGGTAKMYNLQINDRGEIKNSKKYVQVVSRVTPAIYYAPAAKCEKHECGDWVYQGGNTFKKYCSVCRRVTDSINVFLSFNVDSVSVMKTNSKTIKASSGTEFDSEIKYSVDRADIAMVDKNGNLTALETGSCNLFAEIPGTEIKDSVPVNVTTNVFVAEFYFDGELVDTKEYTLGQKSIGMPTEKCNVKEGYTVKWGPYSLVEGGTKIYGKSEPITYTAYFIADAEQVDSVTFTVETPSIKEPPVPQKPGYIGYWTPYSIKAGNIIVNARYIFMGTLNIVNNPSSKQIKISYREGVRLSAEFSGLPEGTRLVWNDGEKDYYGNTFERKNIKNTFTVTVKAVDENGNEIKDENGKTLCDSEKVYVATSLYIRITAFFRYIFGKMKMNVN